MFEACTELIKFLDNNGMEKTSKTLKYEMGKFYKYYKIFYENTL